ncbi:hypothetical protein ABZ639_30660 [Saccharomonospora sp. NPDC006951]
MRFPAMPRPVLVVVLLAGVVVVASLVAAVLLRPDTSPPVFAGGQAGQVKPTASAGCGDEPCRVVASADVNGMTVELLADHEGGTGKLRAGGPGSAKVAETAITGMGVRLNRDSLRCAETATPVCLVRGPHDGGTAGEIHVWRGDTWRAAERPYFSDAGVIVLDDVAGDDTPEVVVVRHDCSAAETAAECQQAPVLAEVFDLRGGEVGCTGTYTSPGELRGWPEVTVTESELGACR